MPEGVFVTTKFPPIVAEGVAAGVQITGGTRLTVSWMRLGFSLIRRFRERMDSKERRLWLLPRANVNVKV